MSVWMVYGKVKKKSEEKDSPLWCLLPWIREGKGVKKNIRTKRESSNRRGGPSPKSPSSASTTFSGPGRGGSPGHFVAAARLVRVFLLPSAFCIRNPSELG